MAEFGIASRIVAPKVNPLEVAGQALQVQQGSLNNRLLSQTVQGKEAIGRIIGAHTNEAGETDYGAVSAEASKDPNAAILMPQIQADALDRQLKKLGLSKAELELSGQRWAKIGDVAGSLLGSREPLTKDAVIGAMKQGLITSGMFNDPDSQKQVVGFLTNLPTDPAAIQAALKQVAMQSNFTSERIGMLLGAPQNVDSGPAIVNQQVSPLTGEVDVNGAIEKGRTPSEKAALVPVYDPTGQKTDLVPSGTLLGDNAPGTSTGPVGQQGPGLGEPEAATGAAQQFVQLRQQAEKTPEVKAALSNIRDTVGGFKPGTKANWAYGVNALATQLGVASPKMKNEAAAQEEFNKLATQFINQQVGALGGTGTDAKLESARHGSPNEFMTKQGIQNVTSLMMGLNDAVAAKNAAAEKWMASGNGPGTYGKFVTQFNKLYDPRVFQSVYMTPEQKQTMLGGMTKDERAEFQQHWTAAKKFGWIK